MPQRPQSARSRGTAAPSSSSSRSGRSNRGGWRDRGRGGWQSPARSSRSSQSLSSRGGPRTPRNPGVSSSTVVRSGPPMRPRPLNNESVADDEPGRDQPEGSVVDEIIMAVDMRDRATIGCAAFNAADGTLALCQDIVMATLDVVEQLIIHVQPTTVLVSGRAPDTLIDFLEKRSHGSGSEDDAEPAHYILRALASSDFANASARERLMTVQLDSNQHVQAMVTSADEADLGTEGLEGPATSHEAWHIKSLRCSTLVNMDSHVSVSAAGAVLADLHRRRSVGFLPDGQAAEMVFHVRTLQMFSMAGHMFVSADTLQSLQIVQSELHPNSQAWGPDPSGTGYKESLSVYGLFHLLACTPQGRSTLRLMFLRPLLDVNTIAERQRTVTLFMRPGNIDFVKQASQVLKRVKNAKSAVLNLKRGIDSPSSKQSFDRGVWATLRRFSAQALQLREIAYNFSGGEQVEIIRKIAEVIDPARLMAVGDAINRTIDFDQSKSRRRPSVKSGIDSRLDDLKRSYDGMGSFLTEVVNHINQKLPEWATQYIQSCIFLPQLGFLTVVELDPDTGKGRYDGEGSDNDQWERVFNFTTDGTACYKNKYMKELDMTHGDIYCEIGDREVEIMHDLARNVLQFEEALGATSDVCGEFDALLALAKGAEKYAWTCPQISQSAILDITGGRHPLQELAVPSFVPNDCILGSEGGADEDIDQQVPSAMVLTGPNHSGKSIYLKQTAVIVYLAHIGSFVPAERATIGITDKILTRISTKESVSGNESAFAIDLRQIGTAIKSATSRSLVLVDEFGKGTNADDGAGLLAATLDHFLSAGTRAPRLLLATHFHELFEGGYLVNYSNLGVAHMEVRTDLEAEQPDQQITYLFNLKPGHSSSSMGGRCAALNGVPSAIVKRAEAISKLIARNEDLVSACAKLSEQDELNLQMAEGVARCFLGFDFDGRPSDDGAGKEMKSILASILACSDGS